MQVRIAHCQYMKAMFAGISLAAVVAASASGWRPDKGDAHRIDNLVVHITDLEATVHIDNADIAALEKIGQGYGSTYRFKNLTLDYKQPDRLRLEGKSSLFGGALLILNGPTRYYDVPKLHLHSTENLTASPAKRQSLLEYGGVVSSGTLAFMEASYVRSEEIEGAPTEVYDLRYTGAGTASSYRVWIDPHTRVTLRREWFDREKKLRATFLYSEPQEVSPGVWLPKHVEVKNAEGTVAVSDVKINQGLDDSLFSTAQ